MSPFKKKTRQNLVYKVSSTSSSNPAVTRKELAYKLQINFDLDQAICRAVVDLFFEIIRDQLIQGEEVRLASFGTFSVVEKKERPGVNISTRELVTIPARRVVRFKPSRKIRMIDYQKQKEADERILPNEKINNNSKATILEIIRQIQEKKIDNN